MKKNAYIYLSLIAFMAVSILFQGCKKTTDNIVITGNDTGNQEIIASDELNVTCEMDQAIDEAVAGLCICKPTSGLPSVNPYSLAGAVIDTSQVDSGIVNVYYYGKETNPEKSRQGSVEIKLPVLSKTVVPWTTKGVTATITFTKYEVFYLNKPNTALWFNGSFTITNSSGGSLVNLAIGDSLVEKVTGPISYTANDNVALLQEYTWNFYKTRVFNYLNTDTITITTRGDTTIGGFNNVSNWGTTRFNQNYYTSILSPLVCNTAFATFYNPLSGVKKIQGIPEPIDDTLGVDKFGIPVSNGTPYGYKINWTNSSGSQAAVISY